MEVDSFPAPWLQAVPLRYECLNFQATAFALTFQGSPTGDMLPLLLSALEH